MFQIILWITKDKKCTHDFVIVEGFQLVHNPRVAALLDLIFLLELDKAEARLRRTQPRDGTLNPNPLQPRDFDDVLWPAHERYMKEKVTPLGVRVVIAPGLRRSAPKPRSTIIISKKPITNQSTNIYIYINIIYIYI